jgi:hypothetical protein
MREGGERKYCDEREGSKDGFHGNLLGDSVLGAQPLTQCGIPKNYRVRVSRSRSVRMDWLGTDAVPGRMDRANAKEA